MPEAAIIAGLVKAPSNYSPTADADRRDRPRPRRAAADAARERRRRARRAPDEIEAVKLAPEPKQNSVRYFTDWALPQLDTLIDETVAPLEVWTTLDLEMQRAADDAIRVQRARRARRARWSALDRDGAVRAMVGGKDYVSSIYNRATQAMRQPGSAFKLFVYLAALEAGHKPDDPVVDEPITINGWSPRNNLAAQFGRRSRSAPPSPIRSTRSPPSWGRRSASARSPTWRGGSASPRRSIPSVDGAGIVRRPADRHDPRLRQRRARRAWRSRPMASPRVTANDEVIYSHEVDRSRVLVAPYVAAQMTDLLQTAVNTGTGRAAQIGRPVAGKTGTTSSNKDGWFLGFSCGLTTGVWMGRDDARADSRAAGRHARRRRRSPRS